MTPNVRSAITVAGAQTGSLAASFNSDPFRVSSMIAAAVQAVVSGSAALDGTLKLQASCDVGSYGLDGLIAASSIPNWTDITGTSQAITADGANMWNVDAIGFRWLRVAYTKTAGTGTLAISASAKGTG